MRRMQASIRAWADLMEDEQTSRQALGVGEKRLLQQATNIQEAHNDNFSTPAFADGYWVMFDYNRGYTDDLETSGIMSLERVPKFSYFFFRSQRGPQEVSPLFQSGPMVKIASYWVPQSSTALRVFSNAEEVELLLNGRSLGRKQPERDKTANRIAHPPFLFDAGKFEHGILEARAFIAGQQVAIDRVQTPEAPHHLVVELDSGVCPWRRATSSSSALMCAIATDSRSLPTTGRHGSAPAAISKSWDPPMCRWKPASPRH